MKKGLSIKFKITLWFSIILIIVTAVTSALVLYIGNTVLQKTIKDNLIETIDNNMDEIEFYKNLSQANDIDQYLKCKNGYLEIDDDFLSSTNGITSALYYKDGTLLYGENSISGKISKIDFSNKNISSISVNGLTYYIYDRQLIGNGLDGLWLRGVVSSEQGQLQISSIARFLVYFLPLFVIMSIIIGFYFAGRALRPIKKISDTAEQIRREDDLKKRIELENGNDELHRLADSFNGMMERLEDAFEAEKQFSSDASHELRTPVSVILAQCEYTLSDAENENDYRDALKTIQRQGKKMDTLISDMLACTRIEANSDKLKKQDVDLSELVNLVCRDMQYINDKNIELTWITEKDIHILGNRELLNSLIVNLISNAYKYGVENGEIKVSLENTGDGLSLSVIDNGIGIADDQQEKIFHRFYQVDPSRNKNGAGLGLTLVSDIAKFHGGTVKVESSPGKGSKFTFFAKKL